jgi:hypothetical protein
MAADETDDQQPDLDPALAQILQGGHDRATTEQLLRRYSQERSERAMRLCQQGWEATRDPAFIVQALITVMPSPLWLFEAIYELATNHRSKEHVTRALNRSIRRRRYEAVCDAKLAGMTWPASYAQAAENLAETPARGSADAMQHAYADVVRDIREGRGDQYITARWPERRRNPTE